MKITVQYHAMLREQKGCAEEQFETEARDAQSLYTQLDLSLDRTHIKVAINDEMVNWDTPFSDGDVVIFIPPVAGG